MIALSPDWTLWSSQPQAHYYFPDMRTFPKNEFAPRSGLAAPQFRREQGPSAKKLKELQEEINSWFRRQEELEQLRGLFVELIRQAYAGFGVKAPVTEDLEEMRTNLSILGEEWKQQWLAEGRAEGKAEGLARGKADALLCLLAERFGEVEPSWREQISGAELATLDQWFRRAIAAPDLSAVFDRAR